MVSKVLVLFLCVVGMVGAVFAASTEDVKERQAKLEGQFLQFDKRLDGLEKRLDRLEKRLAGLETKMDNGFAELRLDNKDLLWAIIGAGATILVSVGGFSLWVLKISGVIVNPATGGEISEQITQT